MVALNHNLSISPLVNGLNGHNRAKDFPRNVTLPQFQDACKANRFSQHNAEFRQHQPVYEGDYLWDSSSVGRLVTLAKTVPPVVTRGAIIVEHGEPHFKSAPLVECPRCNTKLIHGTATLTFRHAPPATRQQQVKAWICSCGEYYVPGEIARDAFLRAFAARDRRELEREETEQEPYPLRGSVIRFERPTEPVGEEDWEALR